MFNAIQATSDKSMLIFHSDDAQKRQDQQRDDDMTINGEGIVRKGRTVIEWTKTSAGFWSRRTWRDGKCVGTKVYSA